MPPVHMKGDGRKAKDPKKTLKRLFSYMKPYRFRMILVVVCILVASLATAISSYSLDPLINDYIVPMTGQKNPNFAPLVTFLVGLAAPPMIPPVRCAPLSVLRMVAVTTQSLTMVLVASRLPTTPPT